LEDAATSSWRGKSGKDQRSFAFAQPFGRHPDSAQPWCLGAPERTGANAAPNRQAGGHWFEPSTAHQKALHKGFFVARIDDGDLFVARKRLAKMFGQEVDVRRDTSVDAAFPLILRRSTGRRTPSCAAWGSAVDARAGRVPGLLGLSDGVLSLSGPDEPNQEKGQRVVRALLLICGGVGASSVRHVCDLCVGKFVSLCAGAQPYLGARIVPATR
jgi:hypothetical protein